MSEPELLAPSGKPARREISRACPKCGAPEAKRVPSCAFGDPHDLCGYCGHEFEEFTCGI